MRQWLEYMAVRVLLCVIQALSLKTCQSVAEGLGRLTWDVLRVRRKIVEENLRNAYPEKSDREREKLGRRMWQHLFLMLFEIAHLPRKLHESNWQHYIRVAGADVLLEALLADRPLVIGSAHFGNFELAGYVLALIGFPTYTVARSLDNPYLDRYVNRFRAAKGQRMIPKAGSYHQIADVLSQKKIMVFLADQYAGRKGCWVRFFGQPASAHKAIALFALAHDAPLLVGSARRWGGPLEYEVRVAAVADPRSGTPEVAGIRPLTQWYTSQLEQLIRFAPEQYWWLHDRWRDRRESVKRQAA